MARSVNKVILIGNVGADPESRTTSSGTKVASVSLATNRQWNDASGQKQEKTEWHRLTFFGKGADVVEQYVKKGDRLYVEGRIEYSSTGEGDARRYFTSIIVNDFVMMGKSGEAGNTGAGDSRQASRPAQSRSAGAPSTAGFAGVDEDDGLPF